MTGHPTAFPKPCAGCGVIFKPRNTRQIYHDLPCFRAARYGKLRKAGVEPKPYISTTSDGKQYWLVRTGGQLVYVHRQVFEEYWNVKLKPYHLIRHINGDTLDNRPENLTLKNEYAMQLLREGKSIANVGLTVCSKGHSKDTVYNMKDGSRLRGCKTCARENSAARYAARKKKAD